jgi:hypothetical protein
MISSNHVNGTDHENDIFSFLLNTEKADYIVTLNTNDFCKRYLHAELLDGLSIIAFELDSSVHVYEYHVTSEEKVEIWREEEISAGHKWNTVINRITYMRKQIPQLYKLTNRDVLDKNFLEIVHSAALFAGVKSG